MSSQYSLAKAEAGTLVGRRRYLLEKPQFNEIIYWRESERTIMADTFVALVVLTLLLFGLVGAVGYLIFGNGDAT